jgi:Carboxylesterase type B
MFWIHGGGNTSGYKGFYNYDELVRREDVVVVSFNYRLGPLGWFTHPAIQGGQSDLDQSSNFGHLDIIAALQWVQRNIATFGGDPNNVTIFGESAGGHNVFAMLASPLAEGLFHKAISQSGYVKSATHEQAYQGQLTNPHIRRSAAQILEQLQVDADATASELRAVSATDLYQAFYELEGDGDVPLTTADGIVIPAEGFMAALGNPRYAKKYPSNSRS